MAARGCTLSSSTARSYDIFIDEQDEHYLLVMQEGIYEVKVEDERTRRLAGLQRAPMAPAGEILIKAPMPGVVVDVPVAAGQVGRGRRPRGRARVDEDAERVQDAARRHRAHGARQAGRPG